MSDDAPDGGGSDAAPGDPGILGRLAPGPLRRRYAVKFAVSILVVVAVIAVVGFYGYQQADRAVGQSTETQLRETTELRADSLSGWVESMRVQTRSVSAGEPLTTDGGIPGAYLTQSRSRLSGDVLSIHLVDRDRGVVAASTETPLRGRSLSELPGDPAWTDADVPSGSAQADARVWVSNRSYLSPVLDDVPVIAFASSVPGREGQYVVVVSRIQTHLETIKQAGGGRSTTVVNEAGGPVLEPESGEYDAARHGEFVSRVRTEGGTAFQVGGGEVHAYAPVNGTDWVAVSSVEKSQAFAVRDAVGRNVQFVVLSGLLALGLVGVVLGRQTVTPLSDLREKTARMESGDLDVDFSSGRADEIGRLYGSCAAMRDSLREQIREAQTARQEAESAREEAERLNDHLERKAAEHRDVLRRVAEGDLTRRMDPESDNRAMTDVAEEFNRAIDEIEVTVARLRRFSGEVAAASQEVTASAEEVQSAGQQVSASIQAISEGAERQNEQFQAVSAEMETLSTTTEQIASLSSEVADLAELTAETGRGGREAAEAAVDSVAAIREGAEVAAGEIDALEAEVEQIDELTDLIREIADETNMLALNANIEASRSEEGDSEGFAVVAREIKELAEEAKTAAEDIEEGLDRIQSQTETTARSVQDNADRIDEGTSEIERAIDALDEVADYAAQTNSGVQEISAATEEQAASTQQVVAMVDEAAEIAGRTADESGTVAAAAEEQSTALTEVSGGVDDLSRQARQLSEALDRFRTDVEEAAGDPSVDAPDPDPPAGSDDDAGFEFGHFEGEDVPQEDPRGD